MSKSKRQYLEKQLEHRLCQMWAPGVKKADRSEDQISSRETLRTYRKEVKRSGRAIFKQFGVRGADDITPQQVQWYIDKLRSEGKSAWSQHTAASALCKALKGSTGPMKDKTKADFNLDVRSYTDVKKGRVNAPTVPQNYVEELEYAIQVRRSELTDFLVRHVVERPEGLFLHVEQGKGGKEQYQRILPTKQDYIREYIRGKAPDEPLVRPEDAHGKENLHAFRRLGAKEAYAYYSQRLQQEPGYREQLKREIVDYARHFDKVKKVVKSDDWRLLEKPYITRPRDGSQPLTFDRTALLATSVFHLSHWRCDVAVAHYLAT